MRSIRVLEDLFGGLGSPQRTVIPELESMAFGTDVRTHYYRDLYSG